MFNFNYINPTPGHRAVIRAERWKSRMHYIGGFNVPGKGAFDWSAHRAACALVGITPRRADGSPIRGTRFGMLWEGMK